MSPRPTRGHHRARASTQGKEHTLRGSRAPSRLSVLDAGPSSAASGRVTARELAEEACARANRHPETPGDGNDSAMLALCCSLCMLVKARGQRVCDGPNKSRLIRPERSRQGAGDASPEQSRRLPRKKRV